MDRGQRLPEPFLGDLYLAAARQAPARQTAHAALRNNDGRGSLTAQFLEIADRAFHGRLGRVGILRGRFFERVGFDLEADWQSPDRSHDLGFARVQRRPARIVRAFLFYRRQAADHADSAVGENFLAVKRRGIHLQFGIFFVLFLGHDSLAFSVLWVKRNRKIPESGTTRSPAVSAALDRFFPWLLRSVMPRSD